MTPNQLADLDEVVGRMTPGPWIACLGSGTSMCTGIAADRDCNKSYLIADLLPKYFLEEGYAVPDHLPNLKGIVALRNSYSLLRDHIKALESKVKELEG